MATKFVPTPIFGTSGTDYLKGTADADIIYGGRSAADPTDLEDTILAGDGNDIVYGNGGNDELYGEAGNDVLYGGVGNDFVSGGAGDDILYGNAGSDQLDGGDGNDILYGGSAESDPSDAGDSLYGGRGNDIIFGNGGDDYIVGGLGLDKIYGGSGSDTMVFAASYNKYPNGQYQPTATYDTGIGGDADRIYTFDSSDHINLKGIDANLSDFLNKYESFQLWDRFTYIDNKPFTDAGQLRAYVSGRNTVIEGSVQRGGGTAFQIVLDGYTGPISARNFIL